MASITIGNKLIPINSENIITESKYIKNSSYSDTQKPYINTSKTLDDALNNLATHNQSFETNLSTYLHTNYNRPKIFLKLKKRKYIRCW